MILGKYNFYSDIVVGMLLVLINVGSLVIFQQQKTKIGDVVALNDNGQFKKLEQKLFFQCLVSSIYYLATSVFYVYIKFNPFPPEYNVINHMIWVSVHIDSSVVYLLVNKELRRKIFDTF